MNDSKGYQRRLKFAFTPLRECTRTATTQVPSPLFLSLSLLPSLPSSIVLPSSLPLSLPSTVLSSFHLSLTLSPSLFLYILLYSFLLSFSFSLSSLSFSLFLFTLFSSLLLYFPPLPSFPFLFPSINRWHHSRGVLSRRLQVGLTSY